MGLLMVLGFFVAVAALIFSGILPGFKSKSGVSASEIVMWGSLPSNLMSKTVEDINTKNEVFKLTYVQKPAESFENILVEALASGNGPDLIIAPQELILKQQNKIQPIPYTSVTQRVFQDTFIDGAKIFGVQDGFLAMPCYVDPLVLYFNKDLYTNAGIINYPKKWEEIVKEQPALTKVDSRNNVTQSSVALGSFSNITNAKDILSMLMMQAGNPIIYDAGDFNRQVTLSETFGYSPSPATAATDFFLQFSDPSKVTYSWNRALPEAQDVFINSKLANYFGLASELSVIKEKNPHLNFDVALMPQQSGDKRLTFGRFYGFAVLRSSKKPVVAMGASTALAGQMAEKDMADSIGVVPVRRDLLATGTTDLFRTVFYNSALISRAWYDFDSAQTTNIFRTMTESIVAGQNSTDNAVSLADQQLVKILK